MGLVRASWMFKISMLLLTFHFLQQGNKNLKRQLVFIYSILSTWTCAFKKKMHVLKCIFKNNTHSKYIF